MATMIPGQRHIPKMARVRELYTGILYRKGPEPRLAGRNLEPEAWRCLDSALEYAARFDDVEVIVVKLVYEDGSATVWEHRTEAWHEAPARDAERDGLLENIRREFV